MSSIFAAGSYRPKACRSRPPSRSVLAGVGVEHAPSLPVLRASATHRRALAHGNGNEDAKLAVLLAQTPDLGTVVFGVLRFALLRSDRRIFRAASPATDATSKSGRHVREP